ncbi:BLUF domain-containing protein [Gilvimarinus sp. SDUM040013]|uniref:BLUF domain-containing protein n=1 Tax=Gilvimarinus gilvus TaxID=3058038 RepID=A0ABU4RZL3_9GAMM|nr:BLUF domain-containing protein [Gilvimarinus sp. SDUM040013]MDO3388104.1 BLUF domain-containing protein [Gilvimarinus sp. SDUM040013]MDX6850321.1 BLUF domain-containing protein [Gilvimarinus sp. SDUM040013]
MFVQVIYASRANFPSDAPVGGVEPTVARILQVSKRNNSKQGIGGALYFRDGAFLQVLEGPNQKVESLLRRLKTDARHKDVTVLHRIEVVEREFQRWSMKYTAMDKKVNQWLQQAGLTSFDPLHFTPKQAAEFADVLRRSEETLSDNGALGQRPKNIRPVTAIAVSLALLTALLWFAWLYAF